MLRAACERGGTETDVFTCDQTRITLLEELGFRDYRVWDRITERALGELPDFPLPDDYSIRSPARDDRADLAAARSELFDEQWTGPEIAEELIAVAADGRVAAFIVMWLDQLTGVGLFEPVGTRFEFRGQGIARALMTEGLRRMHRAGMRRAMVEHDVTNTAAAALYRALGFEAQYETHGFRLSD